MSDYLVIMPQLTNDKATSVKYIQISNKIGLQKKKR